MLVIYTRAYNAEHTIRRTIESILGQSHTDFRYILFNNGSNDSTLAIMQEYAQQDDRIIILSQKLNAKNFSSCFPVLQYISHNFHPDDFLCNVDADDVYSQDFFERMLGFAQAERLDAACCGYNMLDRNSGKLLECKKLENNLVINNEDLPLHFITYRRYTTDMWAKIFKVSLLNYYLEEDRFEIVKQWNHSQQNFIYDAFRNAVRVGFLSEALMDYYVSNTSQKNTRMQGEISLLQARDIFRIMDTFLSSYKAAPSVEYKNKSYQYAIYCNYIKDIIAIIQYSNALSMVNKINYLFDIFTHRFTREMLAFEADPEFRIMRPESKKNLCGEVAQYLLSLPDRDSYQEKIAAILQTIEACGVPVPQWEGLAGK